MIIDSCQKFAPKFQAYEAHEPYVVFEVCAEFFEYGREYDVDVVGGNGMATIFLSHMWPKFMRRR